MQKFEHSHLDEVLVRVPGEPGAHEDVEHVVDVRFPEAEGGHGPGSDWIRRLSSIVELIKLFSKIRWFTWSVRCGRWEPSANTGGTQKTRG